MASSGLTPDRLLPDATSVVVTTHWSVLVSQTIRLWKRTYENPLPDEEVTHLDLASAMAFPAPFVLAITVE